MTYVILVLASALIFFILVPGYGAYTVRRRWRRFRSCLMAGLELPLYRPGRTEWTGMVPRSFRFHGVLEAVQDNDRLWLRDNHSSVALRLGRRLVFVLPGNAEPNFDAPYADSMHSLRWDRTSVLPEGLGVFVCGALTMEDGLPTFGAIRGETPLVILYDGNPETVVARSVWFGRQRNEYWNELTPLSLLSGFAGLMALAVFGFRDASSQYMAIISAVLSVVPFVPLMPPGIIAFFLYRRLWRDGRSLRARRDLAILRQKVALMGMDAEVPVPELPRIYGHRHRLSAFRIRWLETVAVVILVAGVLVNEYIVLALIIQFFNYAL